MSSAYPRGRLAICAEETCQWRNVVRDPTTTTESFPCGSDLIRV
jgi:hypothetical protein